MRRLNLLVIAVAVGSLVPAAGCRRTKSLAASPAGEVAPMLPERTVKPKGSGPTTPAQDALVRVLGEDAAALKAGFATLKADSQPSAFVKMAGEFVDQRETADLAGCPAEFRAARARYLKAWAAVKTTLAKYPDAYDDVEFMDELTDAFGKSRARARKLGGGVVDAVKQVTEAYAEVYTSAEGYGVEVGGK